MNCVRNCGRKKDLTIAILVCNNRYMKTTYTKRTLDAIRRGQCYTPPSIATIAIKSGVPVEAAVENCRSDIQGLALAAHSQHHVNAAGADPSAPVQSPESWIAIGPLGACWGPRSDCERWLRERDLSTDPKDGLLRRVG